ncbi:MAG: hypothetical protein WCE62_06545 [Polyangiales bacterium]
MTRRYVRGHRGLAIVAAALFVQTSAAGAQIPRAPDSPYVAPSDQALLVFSRPPRKQVTEVTFRIVNQAGRCISVLGNGWQTTAPIWPGTHMLLVITGTAPPAVQLLQVKVAAGKTYVIQLRERVNVKSPAEIEVLRRADQPLETFPPAVRDRLPATPELRGCTEWVSWKEPKIQPRARQAKRNWDEASEEQRDAYTVHRNDGWTATEVREP